MRKLLLAGLFLATSLFAQTKLVDGNGNEYILAAAGAKYNSGLTTVSASLTAVTSTTTKVQIIHCTNTTGSAATLTVANGAGTEYFTTVSVAANSVMVVHYGTVGLTYTGGVKLQSGTASALKCQIEGVQ